MKCDYRSETDREKEAWGCAQDTPGRRVLAMRTQQKRRRHCCNGREFKRSISKAMEPGWMVPERQFMVVTEMVTVLETCTVS